MILGADASGVGEEFEDGVFGTADYAGGGVDSRSFGEEFEDELVNDLNGEVVNFFRALRYQTAELCWLLETTPWSRE